MLLFAYACADQPLAPPVTEQCPLLPARAPTGPTATIRIVIMNGITGSQAAKCEALAPPSDRKPSDATNTDNPGIPVQP